MKKILLIEDNLEMRENTAEILELSGFQVETAENGKVGVGIAKTSNPDLIICDIMMPELDGYGVLYLLGKDPETASIPFIFLSAKSDKSDVRKGMGLGADDYLTKPFQESDLINAIETRLKKAENIKQEFTQNMDGLNEFINVAKGQEALLDLSKDRKVNLYKKKSHVYLEGNFPHAVYFINSGKVKTYKTNDFGKDYAIGLHKEGDFIGYKAVMEDAAYSESAVVLEEAEICVIPSGDFTKLIHTNRDVSVRFIKMLSNNILEKEAQLLNLAYGSVRERVAEALIRLKNRFTKEGEETYQISMSREDLASVVGTATESLIRTLSDFKSEGMISISGRTIEITNLNKLSRLAGVS